MNELEQRLAKLSPEQRQLLVKMLAEDSKIKPTDPIDRTIPTTQPDQSESEILLNQFYRSAMELATETLSADLPPQYTIRFAPLKEALPNFSFLELFYSPEKLEEYQDQVLAAQQEMMAVLFRGLDFSALTTVLDIGCGIASDLIELHKQHPHLKLIGYNISPEQIQIADRRIQALGYKDHITLYHRNSAYDPFPDRIDLALSFQVIHHIQEKARVFANLSQHLNNGGVLVAAEILSNLPLSPIEEPTSSAYFAPRTEWSQHLAQNHLRVVEAVDVSQEIANCLYDPNFEANWQRLTQTIDPITQRHLRGPYELGQLLHRNLAIYFLLTIQKDQFLQKETLLRINQAALENPVPYAQVLQHNDSSGNPILHILRNSSTAPQVKTNHFRETLLSQDPAQINALLESYLKTQIATITRLDRDTLNLNQPLTAMGLDSLMLMELRNRIQTDLGLDIPVGHLIQEATVASLIAIVTQQLLKISQVDQSHDFNQPVSWIEGEI
jgi:cyclopropane fatty-acyl-phospholipid synthase-like methyltransferase/acyl carrier protein